ncbi:hypothetical protein V1227_06380 [Lentzea sp. DG1S-22]|nr:hypothetical protein [Lentzea sp. DG1S-22]WVH82379.1 hypothetical protein V1227_06380 [Lentzea sp. DG1S-22]
METEVRRGSEPQFRMVRDTGAGSHHHADEGILVDGILGEMRQSLGVTRVERCSSGVNRVDVSAEVGVCCAQLS